MDGTTARRMAEQLGGQAPALTVEQLKVRLASGAITVDARTVIFVDEASKLDTGHWAELATAVERHGARIRAVGHDGQHDAIRLPGLFSEMLRQPRIPTAELRQIRRHRDPENPAQVHPVAARLPGRGRRGPRRRRGRDPPRAPGAQAATTRARRRWAGWSTSGTCGAMTTSLPSRR